MGDSASFAKDSQAFSNAFSRLHASSDLQFTLPTYHAPQLPRWLEDFLEFLSRHGDAIKWGLAAIALVIVGSGLYALVRRYWPLLKSRNAAPDEPTSDLRLDWRPSATAARQLLQDSDALAAQGRYDEAVHLLLLRSIEDIEIRRPRLVRPAFTSREIGSLKALPGPARAAFEGIMRTVERTRFAGAAIAGPDFERCRRDYEAFAFAPVWQVSAGH
jgi:hypothetical protein